MASEIRFIGDGLALEMGVDSDEIAEELSQALCEERMAVFEHDDGTVYVNPQNVLYVRPGVAPGAPG